MPSTSVTAQVGRSWSDCPHCTLSSRFSGVSPSLNSGPGRSRFRGGHPVCAQTWFLQLQAQRLKPHTLLLTGSLDLASQGVTQQEPPISYQDNLPASCWLERMASWETPAPPQPSYSLTLTLGQAGVPTSGLCLAGCALLLAWSCSLPPYLPSSRKGPVSHTHLPQISAALHGVWQGLSSVRASGLGDMLLTAFTVL